MRAGSERIHRKNTRKFAGFEGGLCKIKIEQLLHCDRVDKIYVSTDDPEVIDICKNIKSRKVEVIIRPSELAASSASTDDLIKYVPKIIPDGHILWTHVTSPFIGPKIYNEMIKVYFDNIVNFDSLMTVTEIQKFIWKNGHPLNYDRSVEKWPRTQTLRPLLEVNSGAFITSKNVYKNNLDRIGENPYLFKLSGEVAFDIDWMPDFKIAEAIYRRMVVENSNEDHNLC